MYLSNINRVTSKYWIRIEMISALTCILPSLSLTCVLSSMCRETIIYMHSNIIVIALYHSHHHRRGHHHNSRKYFIIMIMASAK